MERHLDQELSDLKQELLLMASHAESAVNRAVEALVTRDIRHADKAAPAPAFGSENLTARRT
jgi:phosphate uptake regulator